jgi:hypothetical protein
MPKRPSQPKAPCSWGAIAQKKWKLTFCLAVFPFALNADQIEKRTDACSLIPIGKTQATMIKQNVNAKILRDFVKVECSFWMRTDSADEFLRVAIPNCSMAEDNRPGCIKSFHCLVDSGPVSVVEAKDSSLFVGTMTYNTWFSWKVHFRKGFTHRIDCSYLFPFHGNSFQYILGDANVWSGPLGEGKIVFDHSAVCSKRFIQKQSESSFDLFIRKKGMIRRAYEDSVVYIVNAYYFDSAEKISLVLFRFWSDNANIDRLDTASHFKDIKDALHCFNYVFTFHFLADSGAYYHLNDLHAVKYEILARNGYPFRESAFLRKYFSMNPWYKPNDKFDLSKISGHERIAVGILSSNLDSLKQAMRFAARHRYKCILNYAKIWPVCATPDMKTNIRNGLLEILRIGEEFLQQTLPIYREKIEGKINVDYKKDFEASAAEMSLTTTIKDTSLVNQMLAHIGLANKKPTNELFQGVCSFSTRFSFTIAIEEKLSENTFMPFFKR